MIKKLLLRLHLHWYERNNVVKFEWWVGAYRQACTGGSRGRRVGPNLLPWKALISFYRSSETASMSPESFHLCRPFPTAVTTLGSLRFTCSVQVSFISLWCCLYIWPKERCVFFLVETVRLKRTLTPPTGPLGWSGPPSILQKHWQMLYTPTHFTTHTHLPIFVMRTDTNTLPLKTTPSSFVSFLHWVSTAQSCPSRAPLLPLLKTSECRWRANHHT